MHQRYATTLGGFLQFVGQACSTSPTSWSVSYVFNGDPAQNLQLSLEAHLF